jgi:hypothetical protein
MDKKLKFGISARFVVCIVFGILGTVYFLIGSILTTVSTEMESQTAGLVLLLLGGAFLLVTVILSVLEAAKRKRIRQAVESRQSIWGEISGIERNPMIRVNGRMPYVVLVHYRDHRNQLHLFRSYNLTRYPDPSIIGKQVKIYYTDETFKNYYVDLDGVLPNLIEH